MPAEPKVYAYIIEDAFTLMLFVDKYPDATILIFGAARAWHARCLQDKAHLDSALLDQRRAQESYENTRFRHGSPVQYDGKFRAYLPGVDPCASVRDVASLRCHACRKTIEVSPCQTS